MKVNYKIFLVFFLLNALAQPTKGQTASNFSEAKKLSKETGKPILLNFGFKGCFPCVQLKSDIFNNKLIRERIDSNFHVYYYDIKFEILRLEDIYGVKGYPTTIILDKDERVLAHHTGYDNPINYIQKLFGSERNQSSQNNYKFKIPTEFSNYQEDILIHRTLVRKLLEDPTYANGEDQDPLYIFEDYFYHETNLDSVYVQVVGKKLMPYKKPQKWFAENAEELKELYGTTFMKHLYENYLNFEIPKRSNNYSSLYKRQKKIAEKLTSYLDESTAYKDSIYYRNSFFLGQSLDFDLPGLEATKYDHLMKVLEYENRDEAIIEKLYKEVLELSIYSPCSHKLSELIKVLAKNELYAELPAFMEVQAIAYYRLKQREISLSLIASANEIAMEHNYSYKPIFSSLITKDRLKPSLHKCVN